jgi:hypothetical protein
LIAIMSIDSNPPLARAHRHTFDQSDLSRQPAPPMADLLEGLDTEEVDRGLWHNDFLALGSRLRLIYGHQVALDKTSVAYRVSVTDHTTVRVTCPVDSDVADTVQAACPVLAIAGQPAGIWEFAMRENAQLQLVRLSFDGEQLWVDYQLPFVVAAGHALQAAVSEVGKVARRLRAELIPIC